MFAGEHINVTEDRAVLHTALRRPRSDSLVVDGARRRRRRARGARQGLRLRREGPQRDLDRGHRQADRHGRQHRHRRLRPRPGDGLRGAEAVRPGRPRAAASSPTSTRPTWPRPRRTSTRRRRCSSSPRKTFSTLETLTNARLARAWLLDDCARRGDRRRRRAPRRRGQALRRRVHRAGQGRPTSASTPTTPSASGTGSAAATPSTPRSAPRVAVAIGPEKFADFLAGFHAIDEHFRGAPSRRRTCRC